jgi:hypothetical protein
MHKWLFILLIISANSFAQELPVYMQDVLEVSRENFQEYAKKSPNEIDDDIYDESEYLLFSQIDQIATFDIVFTKEIIREFKKEMVILVSNSFNVSQLESIVKVGNSKTLNKKQAAKFFEIAEEYKLGKIKELNFRHTRN